MTSDLRNKTNLLEFMVYFWIIPANRISFYELDGNNSFLNIERKFSTLRKKYNFNMKMTQRNTEIFL